MKILTLNGNMPHYDMGLGKVLNAVNTTLAELGVAVDEINLSYRQIPYCDGIGSQAVTDITAQIKNADAVIFACTAQIFAPTAIMQTFLEFASLDEYRQSFKEKYCMIAVVSKNGGERAVLEYLSRAVQSFGGYDATRIGLREHQASKIESDANLREIIEKEAEDFYRFVRQNRKRLIPSDAAASDADFVSYAKQPEEQYRPVKIPVAELYKNYNLNAADEKQDSDIKELTRLFADKIDNPNSPHTAAKMPGIAAAPVVTLQQRTRGMPRFFRAQAADGLTAVIHITVNGDETFDGHITVANSECAYADGAPLSAPDLAVTADSAVWREILDGKYAAQKAFMIGSLKIRGDIRLMTRFDTLFVFN
ncbi:MAG: SCP2 sterol-binding domain-containing protein [Defluviitaleaceae bacterium]|nr:SCP2 sterol-binding domain-containing protein [Defluviitaleaceae bacterium]